MTLFKKLKCNGSRHQEGHMNDMICNNTTKRFREKYRLRRVAGMYWLLNVEQPGIPYEKPVALNQTGAMICGMLEEGAGAEEISRAMSASYGISVPEAREDLEQFVRQLDISDFMRE